MPTAQSIQTMNKLSALLAKFEHEGQWWQQRRTRVGGLVPAAAVGLVSSQKRTISTTDKLPFSGYMSPILLNWLKQELITMLPFAYTPNLL